MMILKVVKHRKRRTEQMVVLSGAQRPAEKDLLDRGKEAEMQREVKRGRD